jgi:hypothetical protein
MSSEELLYFIETTEFTKSWEKLGLDDEDDLLALQLSIMAAPRRSPIIKGTGGLRKLRFAPAAWKVGARGAVRVCYVYFEEYESFCSFWLTLKTRKTISPSRNVRRLSGTSRRRRGSWTSVRKCVDAGMALNESKESII